MFDLTKAAEQDKAFIDGVWEKLDKKLSVVAERSRDKVPYTTENGTHINNHNISWWTNGFWPGLMWLMYYGTKNDTYKQTAERTEELLDEALEGFFGLHHDVGFMWHISAGVNYRITGNEKSKVRTMYAASTLAARYNLNAKIIRAWNSDPCVAIIDCMMNIPLLYRESVYSKDDRFKNIAVAHANMAMCDHIRPDGSVHHIVRHDPQTGEVLENIGGQGYGVGSSWSRGQAWAIYGFVLSYIHTGYEEYLDAAKSVAHYFIANAATTDYLPLCDFRAPDEPVYYDSTAAVCTACGLIEIARCVPEYEKKMYIDAAMKLLMAAEKEWCNWDDNEDSVLQMGTEAYYNGIHMPIIYGDFFLAEALLKLKGEEFLMW